MDGASWRVRPSRLGIPKSPRRRRKHRAAISTEVIYRRA